MTGAARKLTGKMDDKHAAASPERVTDYKESYVIFLCSFQDCVCFLLQAYSYKPRF